MWHELYLHAGLLTCALCLSVSGPFSLSNAPAALVSLAATASATASGPPEPPSHITNLRRTQQKAQKLQEEKLLFDADDPYERLASAEGVDADNEAAPSLLQKKVGKLLAKLRFISSLTVGGRGSSAEGGGSAAGTGMIEGDNTNTTTPVDVDFPNATVVIKDNEISNNTTKDDVTERAQTFQKIIYPHSGYGAPIKLSFDVNERIVNRPQAPKEEEEENQKLQAEEETGRLGQIGVFFAEVLGSIVGLIYGAAVQIAGIPGEERNL